MGKGGARVEEQEVLKEQLGTVNQSLFYLMLIILSVLLSFLSVLIQREQLEQTLAGNPQKAAARDAFPIRLCASALVVSALGFFFCLAIRTCREAARGEDPAAQRSACMNAWASLFVLAAALIRLYDLDFMETVRRAPAEDEGATA